MVVAVLLDNTLDFGVIVLQRLVAPPLAQIAVLVVSPAFGVRARERERERDGNRRFFISSLSSADWRPSLSHLHF